MVKKIGWGPNVDEGWCISILRYFSSPCLMRQSKGFDLSNFSDLGIIKRPTENQEVKQFEGGCENDHIRAHYLRI